MKRQGLVGILVLTLVGACARQGFPPGGEPDDRPPRIVSTTPDTFAVVDPGGNEIRIRFSERISERPVRGTIEDAVVVSPATGQARVEHSRTGLRVDLIGGFRPGTVYRVTVLPVLQDMFDNRMAEPYEFFFSTGPPFEDGVLAGTVTDRLTGRPAAVRVEAIPVGIDDPPPHVTVSDSSGIFAFRHLPGGDYLLRAWEDQNRDREPGFREPSGSREVGLGSGDTVVTALRILPGDTTPPVLLRAEVAGPRTIHLTFDDPLPEDGAEEGVEARVTRGAEGPAVAVERVLSLAHHLARLDSLEAEAAPDSVVVRPGEDAPDTARAAPDTAIARAGVAGDARRRAPPGVDPALPNPHLFVLLTGEMEPGVEYRVEVGEVRNVQGTGGGGGDGAVIRPAPAAPRQDPDVEPPPPALDAEPSPLDSDPEPSPLDPDDSPVDTPP